MVVVVALTDVLALWLQRVIKDYKRKCPHGKVIHPLPIIPRHAHIHARGPGCVVGNESIMIRYVVLHRKPCSAATCEPPCLLLVSI